MPKAIVSRNYSSPNFEHGLKGYRRGCKCDVCMDANAMYSRDFRAGKVGQAHRVKRRVRRTNVSRTPEAPPDNVTRIRAAPEPPSVPTEPGPTELALDRDVESFGNVPGKHLMIEQARTMARVLDNPKEINQHSSASRQLMSIIGVLAGGARASKRKSGTRMATVQSLTKHRRAN